MGPPLCNSRLCNSRLCDSKLCNARLWGREGREKNAEGWNNYRNSASMYP